MDNEFPTMLTTSGNTSKYNFVTTTSGDTFRISDAMGQGPIVDSFDSFIYTQTEATKKLNLGQTYKEKVKMTTKSRRVVKIFIIDADENLPACKAILKQTEEFLTDATDQELFFDLDVKALVNEHNAMRVLTKNKKKTKDDEKPVFLEPIRIRDLQMIVHEVISF